MPSTVYSTFGIPRPALVAVAALAPLISLGKPLIEWAGGDPLVEDVLVSKGAALPSTLASGNARSRLDWDGHATVTLADPSVADRLIALLPGLALGVTVGVLVWLLVQFLDSIRDGRVFTPRVVKGLRASAILILVASLVIPLLLSFHEQNLVGAALPAGHATVFELHFSFLWVIPALVMLAVGEAIADGVRLARDTEGLV